MSRRQGMPKYRLHQPSGQAVVTLPDGLGGRKDIYLGQYGTAASRAEYARVLAEWEANGRRLPPKSGTADTTISELILSFFGYAEAHYSDTGKELANFKLSLRALKRLYGRTLAKDFGPKALKALQRAMADGSWMNEAEKQAAAKRGQPFGWCRNVVNRRIARIKTFFRWAESEGLVPPSSWHALRTVPGLPKNDKRVRQTKKVRPATWEQIQAILPYCPRTIAAMLQLQWWSGMRSCEARIVRTCDLEQSRPECWLYRPMKHKNDWRETDQERVIPLGPQCIELLSPWLRPADPQAFLFQPSQAAADRNTMRKALRKTPLTPSQRARNPKRDRKRAPGACYTANSYAHAVARACAKENARRPANQEATVRQRHAGRIQLHAYQCRHGAKQRITRVAGLDAARAVLGQASIGTTNQYAAQQDLTLAAEVAAKYA